VYKLAKTISTVRVKPEHGEALREKAIELTIATKEIVKEAELVHFLLEKEVKKITLEEWIEHQKEK
jgi:hypothetical protein